jgi:hypothetical protein
VVRENVAPEGRAIVMYRGEYRLKATPSMGMSTTFGQAPVGPTWTSSLYKTRWIHVQTAAISAFATILIVGPKIIASYPHWGRLPLSSRNTTISG